MCLELAETFEFLLGTMVLQHCLVGMHLLQCVMHSIALMELLQYSATV